MKQNKIKAVKKWKIPTKVKEVKSFLEFTNFYRRFIQNFSYMAKLLQLQDLRVGQIKEPYIRVNTRELNKELCTGSSTFYTKLQWSMLLLL